MTAKSSKNLCGVVHMILVAYFVDVIQDEREVEEERKPLPREEEEDC